MERCFLPYNSLQLEDSFLLGYDSMFACEYCCYMPPCRLVTHSVRSNIPEDSNIHNAILRTTDLALSSPPLRTSCITYSNRNIIACVKGTEF